MKCKVCRKVFVCDDKVCIGQYKLGITNCWCVPCYYPRGYGVHPCQDGIKPYIPKMKRRLKGAKIIGEYVPQL